MKRKRKQNNKVRGSITRKLVILFITIVTMIIALYSLISTYFSIKKIENDIDIRLEKTIHTFSNYFEMFNNILIVDSNFMSQDHKLATLISKTDEESIYNYVAYNSEKILNEHERLHIEVIDKNNYVYFLEDVPEEFSNKRDINVYKEQLNNPGVSLNVLERESSISIKAFSSIYSLSGRGTSGIVSVGYHIGRDNWYANRLRNFLNTEVMIFNSKKIVSSTFFDSNTLEYKFEVPYSRDIIKSVIENQTQKKEIISFNGSEYSVIYFPLKTVFTNTKSVIGIALSRDEITERKIEAVIFFFVFGVIFTILAYFTAVRYTTRITKPILKLSKLTSKISKGNYNLKLKTDYTQDDEIGSLITSFSKMIETINEYSESLEEKVLVRTNELKSANAKLRNLDKMKNEFIANITHNFRSPLTVILNLSELRLQRKNEIDSKSFEIFESIYKASFKLTGIVDKLLSIAKMDAKGVQLTIEHVDIKGFIEALVSYHQSLLKYTNINIKSELPENKIKNFFTDKEKLEEVFNNVFSNAIKFVNLNTGKVTIELVEYADYIEIKISDNGIGIEKDKLEKIFNKFEQSESGLNSTYIGSGIGLAYAKQLTSFLKGEIHAESKGKDKGAVFTIKLLKGLSHFDNQRILINDGNKEYIVQQRDVIHDIKLQEDKTQVFIKNRNSENEFDIKKSLILIVEDEISIQKIIMEYLEIDGFNNFIITSNGKQALEAFYEYNPDIIISDVNMPYMNGEEFHDEIIVNPNNTFIPFVFISAIHDENRILSRKEKGAVAYITKPIKNKELLLTIKTNLNKYFEYLKTIRHATIDEQTQLLNKRSLNQSLHNLISRRKYINFSIIFCDLDHFKNVNDTYGHQGGDYVLTEVGKLISETLRNGDIAGRYGGEEFLIILPESDLDEAFLLAEKLRKKLEKLSLQYNDNIIRVTSSFGISSLFEYENYICSKIPGVNKQSLKEIFSVDNPDEVNWQKINEKKQQILAIILEMADQALYKAKSTICTSCSYSSTKHEHFDVNKCPDCGKSELVYGRNKVVKFETKTA